MSAGIEVTVTKTICVRRCPSIKKKLFGVEDMDADPELTLKLLKITPKENELEVRRSDSEFLQDFNSTSMKQQCTSQVIISTEGSDNLSMDNPTLEQAYRIVGNGSTYSSFKPQNSSLAVPTLSNFSHNIDMQSGVLSDRTMDASMSIDGPNDHSARLMQSSVALESSNPFSTSGNLMYPQGA